MLRELVQWLESHMLVCQTKSATGLDCFGCGLQRSLILLLKGEFVASLIMYPPLLPTLIMIGFLLFHLKMKFEHGAAILKGLFIFNVALMVVNMLLKNFF